MPRFIVGAKNLTIRITTSITRPRNEQLMCMRSLIFNAGTNTDIDITYTAKRAGIEYTCKSNDRTKNDKILQALLFDMPIELNANKCSNTELKAYNDGDYEYCYFDEVPTQKPKMEAVGKKPICDNVRVDRNRVVDGWELSMILAEHRSKKK